ncbi:MAG: ATPase domain-containing protein [Candidatus Aenigmatarchaeota archaeon]|nr:AAA family ATPase [Candidatus Aenigmarchaeota archaeon]
MTKNVDFDRIPTGIPGLDKMIEGGFIRGSNILVYGGPGVGKSIFVIQFIYEGLKNGENCMIITLEESPEDLKNDVKRFGWDLEKYEKQGKLTIIYKDPFQVTNIIEILLEEIRRKKISRLAIDSVSTLALYFEKPFEMRKQLFKLINAIKETGCTTVFTAEKESNDGYNIVEYVADGVIDLISTNLGGQREFTLEVKKMRRTKNSKEIKSYKISDLGISISN